MENYEVVKTIGKGSYGQVCLATHRATGQQVCFNHSKLVGNTCELAILPSTGSAEDLQDERAEDGARSQTFTQGDRHYAETERSRQHRQIH